MLLVLGFRSMVWGLNRYMDFGGIASDKNLADSHKLHVGFHSFKELSITRLFLTLFCA